MNYVLVLLGYVHLLIFGGAVVIPMYNVLLIVFFPRFGSPTVIGGLLSIVCL